MKLKRTEGLQEDFVQRWKCPDGHPLRSSTYALDGYEKGWVCSTCASFFEHIPRAFCSECYWDVCEACKDDEDRWKQAGEEQRERERKRKGDAEKAEISRAEARNIPEVWQHSPSTPNPWPHIEGHGAYCPACQFDMLQKRAG